MVKKHYVGDTPVIYITTSEDLTTYDTYTWVMKHPDGTTITIKETDTPPCEIDDALTGKCSWLVDNTIMDTAGRYYIHVYVKFTATSEFYADVYIHTVYPLFS